MLTMSWCDGSYYFVTKDTLKFGLRLNEQHTHPLLYLTLCIIHFSDK